MLWAGVVDRPVPLISEILESVLKDARVGSHLPSDKQGAVGAAGVIQDDVVDVVQTSEASRDIGLLVEGQNDH